MLHDTKQMLAVCVRGTMLPLHCMTCTKEASPVEVNEYMYVNIHNNVNGSLKKEKTDDFVARFANNNVYFTVIMRIRDVDIFLVEKDKTSQKDTNYFCVL